MIKRKKMITNNKNKDGTSAGANHTASTNHTTGVDKQEKGNSNSNYSSFYRIRKYNNTLKAFSDWETFAFSQELDDKDNNEAGETDEAGEADKTDKADKAAEGDEIYFPRKNKDIIIDLNRGKGKLTIHKKIVKNSHRQSINNYMDTSELNRQYKIRGFKETRVHVLLSNKCRGRQPSKVRQSSSSARISTSSIQKEEVIEEAGHGYRYHGVHMKATSLSIASKSVHKLSKKLAKIFHLPRKEWNIGTELLVYRCGKDRRWIGMQMTHRERP
jgi:hypothetical protein